MPKPNILLTPEMQTEMSSTKVYQTWDGMHCVRFHDDFNSEEHPCYYCGKPIPIVSDMATCNSCGFAVCPACGSCSCKCPATPTYMYARSLRELRERYCCNPIGFARKDIDPKHQWLLLYVPHFEDALNYCRKKRGIIG